MNKYIKKILCPIFIIVIALVVTGCDLLGGKKSTTTANNREKLVLPDYENMESDELIIAGFYSPTPTMEAYQEYKDCGFNYVFALGTYAGNVGSAKITKALEICDELDIKVFIDVTRNLSAIDATAGEYVKHSSFAGYSYDEPVIYKNTLNNADGIVDIAPVIQNMHEKFPTIEFMLNLNPSDATKYNWGTPVFTYDEYLDAQTSYINSIYADSTTPNWISCDSYPICNNTTLSHPYCLKTVWLQDIAYLAETKRDSETELTSNFFIQTMPYGTAEANHDRVPTYEDIRLQAYTVLAFGFDSISYFCYCTPPSSEGGEFQADQQAMIDVNGNQTEIYASGKKVNAELRSFEKIYMQFNDNWVGVCPIYGTNNTSKDEFYYNKTMDCLVNPLDVKYLNGIESIKSEEDIIVGYMKDGSGNSGFMIVNYNDSSLEKTTFVEIDFGEFTQALVCKNGEVKTVDLENGVLGLNLDVCEGAFVIPCA